MSAQPEIAFSRENDGTLVVGVSGDWTIGSGLPSADEVLLRIESDPGVAKLRVDTSGLGSWDSSILVFLSEVFATCSQKNVSAGKETIPQGIQKLLDLASAEHQRKDIMGKKPRGDFIWRTGDITLGFAHGFKEMLAFIGEASLALGRLFAGRANFRLSDLLKIIQDTGAQSLPIVALISGLVGLILAFVGSIQLRLFGAQIYVADVVGIGMVRVMGAVMTGIIVAGRTGASFAAQLGTMQVNEEIDALKTLGISPMEFLVLPRMLALVLMVPLLCLYADLMGILGGMFVGLTMLNISFFEYYTETKAAVSMTHLWVGLFHSAIFGVLVALSGCLRGIQCERSASAVGYATTSAVVTGIVSIVVATAIITFGCEVLRI